MSNNYIQPSVLPLFDGDPMAGLKLKLAKTAVKIAKAAVAAVVAEVATTLASKKTGGC